MGRESSLLNLNQARFESPLESARRQSQGELSPEEERLVQKLRQRDAEVRAHEQAHAAKAGPYLRSGPSYTYQVGPDGRRYAIGGEVQVDTSPGRTPEETLRKAQTIKAAAVAPAQPSPQDFAVAASAALMESQARSEITEKEANKNSDSDSQSSLSQALQRIYEGADAEEKPSNLLSAFA